MKTSYEIQTLQRGRWKIASIFDDFDLAVYEARRIENAGRFRGVRVVKEDVEGNPFAQKLKAKLSVVFAAGEGAEPPQPRGAAPALDEPGFGSGPTTPPPIPDIPELSADGDLSPGRGSGGRRRRRKKQDNTLVIVLSILLGVLLLAIVLGAAIYFGLQGR